MWRSTHDKLRQPPTLSSQRRHLTTIFAGPNSLVEREDTGKMGSIAEADGQGDLGKRLIRFRKQISTNRDAQLVYELPDGHGKCVPEHVREAAGREFCRSGNFL